MGDEIKGTENKIRELSENEIAEVGGGFWPAVAIILVLTECATIPHRRDDNELNK